MSESEQDFTQPPDKSVVDQMMESRKYWDEKRQVNHLEVQTIRGQCTEAVRWFCEYMRTDAELGESDVEGRAELVKKRYQLLAPYASICRAIAKITNAKQAHETQQILLFMLRHIEHIQEGMEVNKASNTVIDTLGQLCYGTGAAPKQERGSKKLIS
jgi:superfamily II DNA helicase RecQ